MSESTLTSCAEHIVARYLQGYLTECSGAVILHDAAHSELARHIAAMLPEQLIFLPFNDAEGAQHSFAACLRHALPALVFAEPRMYRHLVCFFDYSQGAPLVKDLKEPSQVIILPAESTARVFSVDVTAHETTGRDLLSEMASGSLYRVTNPAGTDLVFRAREWLIRVEEVLTAPIEDSIHGIIAVDGSFFYRTVPQYSSISMLVSCLVLALQMSRERYYYASMKR